MNAVNIEIPDDVSVVEDDGVIDTFSPSWRDRMAFGFALRAIKDREMSLATFKLVATTAYDFADTMIAESKQPFC